MARTPEPRYIDTDKAFALLGDYPEAETDKKVFTCIAFACDRKGNAALSDYEIAEKNRVDRGAGESFHATFSS